VSLAQRKREQFKDTAASLRKQTTSLLTMATGLFATPALDQEPNEGSSSSGQQAEVTAG